MAGITDVVAQVRAAAQQVPVETVARVVDATEETAAAMAELGDGTSNPELADAVALYAQAHRQAADALALCLQARRAMLAIADRLQGDTGTATVPRPQGASVTQAPRQPSGRDERIEQARRSLPPGMAGTQAQGRWLGPGTDVTVVRSGKGDQWYDKAKAFAAGFSWQFRAAVDLASHVEVKLAMRMREESRNHETVVIDRTVCGRRPFDRNDPFTCDKMLKWFLPPGATLTVVEHDGTAVTYQGEGSR